jgi:hypothetical protein
MAPSRTFVANRSTEGNSPWLLVPSRACGILLLVHIGYWPWRTIIHGLLSQVASQINHIPPQRILALLCVPPKREVPFWTPTDPAYGCLQEHTSIEAMEERLLAIGVYTGNLKNVIQQDCQYNGATLKL